MENKVKEKNKNPKGKVVFVIGATGVGKSKLAIQIAEKYSGEIISADSIQIYQGLDICSAKVTKEERQQVPHHLLDFVEPTNYSFTVFQFIDKAIQIIEKLHSENKLVVVVGGSHQYIEGLLLEEYLSQKTSISKSSSIDNLQSEEEEEEDEYHYDEEKKKDIEIIEEKDINREKEENKDSRDIEKDYYSELQKVDPKLANLLHKNDIRKIKRALQIYHETGIPQSQHLLSRRNIYRYDSLVIWIQCDRDVLNKRLDNRIHDMLEKGMIEELISLRKDVILREEPSFVFDYTKGIFQSIGYKEFEKYLKVIENTNKEKRYKIEIIKKEKKKEINKNIKKKRILTNIEKEEIDKEKEEEIENEEEEEEEEIKKKREIFEECVDKLKQQTRKYSKKQIQWISKRLSHRVKIFSVDSSRVENWDSECLNPALNLVEKFIHSEPETFSNNNGDDDGLTLTDQSHFKQNNVCPNDNLESWKKYYCERCKRELNGINEWTSHLKSRQHKKRKNPS